MEIRLTELSSMLQIPEKTLVEWMKEKQLPAHRIGKQIYFNRNEIAEWILDQMPAYADRLMALSGGSRERDLADLIELGGVHVIANGSSVAEVLHQAVDAAHAVPGVSKDEIISAVVDRERLMSTAVGRGIAIPHPRNPLVGDVQDAFVAICYLQRPVDFGALDGVPVHTLFLLISDSPRRHLAVLSRISYLCQDAAFTEMLGQRAGQSELVMYVRQREAAWPRREAP